MSAGTLDQRVELRRRDHGASASGSGARVEEWPLVAVVWARVEPVSGVESEVAGGVVSATTWRLRIRWRKDFDTTWRAVWRGRTLDIVSATPAGLRLREWLDLTAIESLAENPVRG